MEQEQFDFLEDIEIDKPDVEFQKWKEQKREAKSRMIAMQCQPYEVKRSDQSFGQSNSFRRWKSVIRQRMSVLVDLIALHCMCS